MLKLIHSLLGFDNISPTGNRFSLGIRFLLSLSGGIIFNQSWAFASPKWRQKRIQSNPQSNLALLSKPNLSSATMPFGNARSRSLCHCFFFFFWYVIFGIIMSCLSEIFHSKVPFGVWIFAFQLRENCFQRVREDRKRLLWKMRALPNSPLLSSDSNKVLFDPSWFDVILRV